MDFILNTEFIILMVGLCRLDSCFYTQANQIDLIVQENYF